MLCSFVLPNAKQALWLRLCSINFVQFDLIWFDLLRCTRPQTIFPSSMQGLPACHGTAVAAHLHPCQPIHRNRTRRRADPQSLRANAAAPAPSPPANPDLQHLDLAYMQEVYKVRFCSVCRHESTVLAFATYSFFPRIWRGAGCTNLAQAQSGCSLTNASWAGWKLTHPLLW